MNTSCYERVRFCHFRTITKGTRNPANAEAQMGMCQGSERTISDPKRCEFHEEFVYMDHRRRIRLDLV